MTALALPSVASAATTSNDNASILKILTGVLTTFSQMLAARPAQTSTTANNYISVAAFAPSQRIDNLSNVTISNATVSNVSGLTISDIPSLPYLPVSGGVLTGSTTLTNATSTTFFSTVAHFTTGIIDALTATASTITNLIATTINGTNATFTNATTTNATSTNLYVSNLGAGAASTTNLTFATAFGGSATTTNLAVTGTASSSALVASNSFIFKNVSGFLKATAGAVATSLINLASDVTGILPVANGGTGWSNIAAGSIPYGNGASALATTTAGSAGQVLALLNGAPTWTPTTTLSTISGTLATNQGGTGTTTWQLGSIPFFNGARLSEDAGNLLWDSTNHRLGIGTATPADTLDVVGNAFIGDPAVRGESVYLMSTFLNSNNQLYLMTSNDGAHWSFLSQSPVYNDPTGSVRDPSIMRYNGKYYVAYTKNGFNDSAVFAIASSPDLVNWTWLTDVTVLSGATGKRVWAPEWFVDSDGTISVFVAATPPGGGSTRTIYNIKPTNSALTSWTSATQITGTNLPSDMIDPFVVKTGSTYYLWYKNDTTKYVEYASSQSLTSGYSVVGSGDWAGWGSGLEGESLVQIDNTTWRIYLDKYTAGGLYYSESSDNWATWTAKQLITSPAMVSIANTAVSHPTVIRVRDVSTWRNIDSAYLSNNPVGQDATHNLLIDWIYNTTAGNARAEISTYGGNNNLVLQGGGGNVGIGTSTPTDPLEIAGITGGHGIRLDPSSPGGAVALITDKAAGGSSFYITRRASGGTDYAQFIGGTNNVDFFGNIGIGTSSPTTALQVNGVVTPNADNTSSLGNATYRWSSVFAANGTIQTSDARLKSDVTDLNYGLSDLLKLRPVSFTWIAQPQQGTQLGFIAQEVQPLFPETVNVGDDANHTLGITYTEFIPVIVKSIQQLTDEVANFADSFTTKELTFTRATGDELDAHRVVADQLCAKKSDGTPICVTGDQLAAALQGAPSSGSAPSPDPAGDVPVIPDTIAPDITIRGNNPTTIHVGDSYSDLGATVTDNVDQNLGYKTFLNGTLASNIIIDTSAVATDTIDYVATDNAGNTATSTRTVIIQAVEIAPGDATTTAQ